MSEYEAQKHDQEMIRLNRLMEIKMHKDINEFYQVLCDRYEDFNANENTDFDQLFKNLLIKFYTSLLDFNEKTKQEIDRLGISYNKGTFFLYSVEVFGLFKEFEEEAEKNKLNVTNINSERKEQVKSFYLACKDLFKLANKCKLIVIMYDIKEIETEFEPHRFEDYFDSGISFLNYIYKYSLASEFPIYSTFKEKEKQNAFKDIEGSLQCIDDILNKNSENNKKIKTEEREKFRKKFYNIIYMFVDVEKYRLIDNKTDKAKNCEGIIEMIKRLEEYVEIYNVHI